MADFNWRTEEEDVRISPALVLLRRSGRRLWFLAIGFTFMLLIVSLAIWRLDQRIDSQTQQVENDVSATFHTWQQAVNRSDNDILNTLLIGNRTQWMIAQRDLLKYGRTLDRTILGLPQATDMKRIIPKIDLAADWLSAELTFELLYQNMGELPSSSSVQLEHTLSFKREGSRWLLAERGPDFWGEWERKEGPMISYTYRARDTNEVHKLIDDLERELEARCRQLLEGLDCPEEVRIRVRFESDPTVLLQAVDQETPIVSGRAFVLPTPTLVGIPVDEDSYRSLFTGYTRPIVEAFSAILTSPIPLPQQHLQILCFSQNTNRQSLFSYDALNDHWTAELPGRSFRYLSPMANDQGLMLIERLREVGPNRLRVIRWQNGQDSVLFDEDHDLLMNPIGWSGSVGHPELLVHSYETSAVNSDYSRIRTQSCPTKGCPIEELGGFVVWSPDGRRTLVVQSGDVHLGDEDGNSLVTLGQGFSSFWMSDDRYGFVRYTDSEDDLMVEILVGQIGGDRPDLLLDSADLASLVSRRDVATLFVNFVVARPGDPNTIFFTARTYAGNESNFYLFSARIEETRREGHVLVEGAKLQLYLELDQAPSGFPSPLAATGYVPLVLSLNGRWVSLAVKGETIGEAWTLFNLDLEQDVIKTMPINYPLSTFIRPYLDWTSDGQWLITVEKDFLRLSAPDYDYSRPILHEHHACSHVAWIN